METGHYEKLQSVLVKLLDGVAMQVDDCDKSSINRLIVLTATLSV